jgi:hypothetical protein
MSNEKAKTRVSASSAYVVFAISGLAVYHSVGEGEFWPMLTMSALIQCLGIALLCTQVLTSGTAAGISAGALMLDACAFSFRLSSTLWLDGYLPTDQSGDYVYQLVDACSLVLILWLLHRVVVVQCDTYDESADSFQVAPVVLACLGLAALLHADLNDKPLFDTFWMASAFIGAVSVLPQLALSIKSGGYVEALTSHYIMALAVSRVLSFLFFWEVREDITCNEWIAKGFSHAVWALVAAQVLHMLLLADFAYSYLKAFMKLGVGGCLSGGGLTLPVYVGTSEMHV